MIEEPKFKKKFLETLNQRSKGWIDGDKETGKGKKVDILNHNLKIAIEIKDDTKYKIIADGVVRTNDLVLMNQRFSDHIKSANNKFKLYPDYKSVILFRTEHISGPVKYAIEGLDQYNKVGENLVHIGKVGKYSKFAKNEVGGFLILNYKVAYFTNYHSKPERVISKEDLIKYTDWEIEDL